METGQGSGGGGGDGGSPLMIELVERERTQQHADDGEDMTPTTSIAGEAQRRQILLIGSIQCPYYDIEIQRAVADAPVSPTIPEGPLSTHVTMIGSIQCPHYGIEIQRAVGSAPVSPAIPGGPLSTQITMIGSIQCPHYDIEIQRAVGGAPVSPAIPEGPLSTQMNETESVDSPQHNDEVGPSVSPVILGASTSTQTNEIESVDSLQHNNDEIQPAFSGPSVSPVILGASTSTQTNEIQPAFAGPPVPPQISRGAQRFNFRILYALVVFWGISIGYSTSILGGVLDMHSYSSKFSRPILKMQNHAREDNFCTFYSWKLQLFIASIWITTAMSEVAVYIWRDRCSIRTFSIIGCYPYLLGVFMSSRSATAPMQIMGRLLTGSGLGIAYQAIPMASELAPADLQPELSILFTASQKFGAALAQGINLILYVTYKGDRGSSSKRKDDGREWGYSFLLGIIPALLAFVTCLLGRSSPMWLIQPNRVTTSSRPTFAIKSVRAVLLALLGLDAVVRYGPLILAPFRSDSTSDTEEDTYGLWAALFTTVLSMATIWCSVSLRPLRVLHLWWVIVLASGAIGLFREFRNISSYYGLSPAKAANILRYGILYIIGWAGLSDPRGWLEHSTISLLGSTWLLALDCTMSFLADLFVPWLVCTLTHGWVYIIFIVVSVVIGVFMLLLVPGTDGVAAHDMATRVWARHWFWRRNLV